MTPQPKKKGEDILANYYQGEELVAIKKAYCGPIGEPGGPPSDCKHFNLERTNNKYGYYFICKDCGAKRT